MIKSSYEELNVQVNIFDFLELKRSSTSDHNCNGCVFKEYDNLGCPVGNYSKGFCGDKVFIFKNPGFISHDFDRVYK